MHTLTNYILWLLASITGAVFGIFLASSLDLHDALYIFSLAGFFGIVFAIIAYNFTKFFINRISGRTSYMLAGAIVLVAIVVSGFLLIEAYL